MLTVNGERVGLFGRVRQLFGKPVEDPNSQRRRHVRRNTEGLTLIVLRGRDALSATIQDVSASGMRLRSSIPFNVGQAVTLRHEDHNTTLSARVSWCRRADEGCEFGVQFTDASAKVADSWIATILLQLGSHIERCEERRQARRIRTELTGAISTLGGRAQSEVLILDVSEGGALVQTSTILNRGMHVRLSTTSGFDVEARVLRAVRDAASGKYRVNVSFIIPSAADSQSVQETLRRLNAAA